MENPVESTRRRRRHSEPLTPGAWFGRSAIALLPVLACVLAGGTQKWAEGVVVALLGAALIVRPPRVSLGGAINFLLVALIGLAAVGFVPARWFYFPQWRVTVVNDLKIVLPATVSPQPWITATWLISLIAGVAWLYFVSTQELELRAVRVQLRVFVVGVVVLAAFSIVFYMMHAAPSFWVNQRGFGPFPNRNQTADLFGITAVVLLACGQDDVRFGRKRWVFWLAGLGVLIAALAINLSRAGLVILVGGCAVWMAIVALRQRSPGRLALGISFLLVLFSAVLLAGGETLERFHLRGLQGLGISSDFRWLIFKDTFRMIGVSPWCGVGLGSFDPVFALFREASLADTRSIHPESDWLWIWSELGLPAVLVVIASAVLFFRRIFPLHEGTNQRFRLAAALAALLFALHGIVDVSAHRVGTAYSGLFLLGLSLHRPLQLNSSRLVPVVFRLIGALLLVSGASWVIAARTQALLPGSVGVTNARLRGAAANSELNFTEATAVVTRGLTWAPLDWQLYFVRALAEAGQRDSARALPDFDRARFLEPNGFEVPLAEGNAWLSAEPTLAPFAFREAIRRAGDRRAEIYSVILSNSAQKNPAVGQMMEQVGLARHDLVLPYLNRVGGETFQRAIEQVLRNDPELNTFAEPEKFALFTLWSERGIPEQLSIKVQEHPNWRPYAWLGLAKFYAGSGDFRAAYELTQRYGEAVALPKIPIAGSFDELRQRYENAPDSYPAGYAFFRAQMDRGRVDDALVTVRHFTERAGAPPYFYFLEAQAWAVKQDWERAWNAWQKFRTAQVQSAR